MPPPCRYVTASAQLAAKAEQLPRLAATLAVQPQPIKQRNSRALRYPHPRPHHNPGQVQRQLSKEKTIERFAAAQQQALELLDRIGGRDTQLSHRFAQASKPPFT